MSHHRYYFVSNQQRANAYNLPRMQKSVSKCGLKDREEEKKRDQTKTRWYIDREREVDGWTKFSLVLRAWKEGARGRERF
ncbi:hypothetical protein BDR04DRAFT_1093126, partial [Suillus decipiens]